MLAAGVQQIDVGDGRVGDADAEGGARGGRGGRSRGRDGGDGEVGRVLGLLFFFSPFGAKCREWGAGDAVTLTNWFITTAFMFFFFSSSWSG